VAPVSFARIGRKKLQTFGACAAALGAVFVSNIAAAEQSELGSLGARGARWQQSSVTVSVEASVDQLGTDAFEAVMQAVSAWQNAPGMLPTLVVQRGPEDPIGYRRSGKNSNTVRFAPDGDPLANGALAITVITFDAHAKQILDADVVLNGEHGFSFFDHDARNEGMSTYDLQNVLTHELGHLLGLGEDFDDNAATMYAFSQPGETGKRDLEIVDRDSIADLYSEELEPGVEQGCGGAAIAGYDGASWAWAAVGLGALGFAMRRRALRGPAALTLTALGALLCGSSGSAAPDSAPAAWQAADESVPMTVTSSESSWEGNIIVTRLGLQGVDAAHVSHSLTVRTLGGQVDNLVQVVGHLLPPRVGASLRMNINSSSADGALWVAPRTSPID
jgi:predicted Zn-dependent protease